jgi:hypothetical protein
MSRHRESHRRTHHAEWKPCATGKRGWLSKGAARAGNDSNRHALHIYQCEVCRLWHAAKRNE